MATSHIRIAVPLESETRYNWAEASDDPSNAAPPFPFAIWSLSDPAYGLSPNLVTVIKHSDRIHEIDPNVSTSTLAESTALGRQLFPGVGRPLPQIT